MIANFFKETKPYSILYVLILLFIFFISSFFVHFNSDLNLRYLGLFIVHMFIFFVASFIIQKNKLTKRNTYALFITSLFLGAFPEAFFSVKIIFSAVFVMFSFRKIFSLKNQNSIKKKLFDAGFWLGISLILFNWSILYLPLIYVAIIIYGRSDFRNYLIPIIGLSTPLLIFFTYNFMNDSADLFLKLLVFKNEIYFSFISYKDALPSILFGVVTFISIIIVSPKIISRSNQLKNAWLLVNLQLLLSLIIVLVSPLKSGAEMYYLAFPASIVMANFIQQVKSNFYKNIVLYLLLLAVFFQQFLQFISIS